MNEKWTIGMMLLRQRFRDAFKLRNTGGDRIMITEQYIVKSGSKILFATKGHIVNVGLMSMGNLFAVDNWGNNSYPTPLFAKNWGSMGSYLQLGTGGNVTTATTTALTTPSATKANSQSGSYTNPSNGVYKVNFTATWNAGSLGALTITEMGLWLAYPADCTTMQTFGASFGNSATVAYFFFSRISAADGDFTSFVINTSVPLTITWTLTFQYA